jgi:hypothetical protein
VAEIILFAIKQEKRKWQLRRKQQRRQLRRKPQRKQLRRSNHFFAFLGAALVLRNEGRFFFA